MHLWMSMIYSEYGQCILCGCCQLPASMPAASMPFLSQRYTICFSNWVYYVLFLFGFSSWGILPPQSCWSLFCDHGLRCSDELMWEQQQCNPILLCCSSLRLLSYNIMSNMCDMRPYVSCDWFNRLRRILFSFPATTALVVTAPVL